ncbi:hypothetical protein IAU59_000187 [Kwoniella sp. CBS 9459]
MIRLQQVDHKDEDEIEVEDQHEDQDGSSHPLSGYTPRIGKYHDEQRNAVIAFNYLTVLGTHTGMVPYGVALSDTDIRYQPFVPLAQHEQEHESSHSPFNDIVSPSSRPVAMLPRPFFRQISHTQTAPSFAVPIAPSTSHKYDQSPLYEDGDVGSLEEEPTDQAEAGPAVSRTARTAGSISVTIESPELHVGRLWTMFHGKLTYVEPTEGGSNRQIPVIIKHVRPPFFAREIQYDDPLFGYYGCHDGETAWKDARNEDATLRRLVDFQGGFLPNYYGLYGWSSSSQGWDQNSDTPPEVAYMIMEDVDEQKYFSEDRLRVIAQFEDLHRHGQTVQGNSAVKIHHILRRATVPPEDPRHFVLVDLHAAQSLLGIENEDDRIELLCADDCGLADRFPYDVDRDSQGLLFDECDGKPILGLKDLLADTVR